MSPEIQLMGYTTEFDGRFEMNKLPPTEVVVRLNELDDIDGREQDDDKMPSGYNQWKLTPDCRHIEWDGGEKFYDYVEWLQYIIDTVLTPNDIALSGSVAYSGENASDNGILTIENGIAVQRPHAELSNTLADLTAFKTFVLAHEYGDKILRDYNLSLRK